MKRGRMYAAARREGWNTLALGQHLDDLAESFLMSVFLVWFAWIEWAQTQKACCLIRTLTTEHFDAADKNPKCWKVFAAADWDKCDAETILIRCSHSWRETEILSFSTIAIKNVFATTNPVLVSI